MNVQIPNFNVWTIFLLMAAGQGLFLALLLISSQEQRKRGGIWLSAIVLVFSLTLFDYLGYWTKAHFLFPHFSSQFVWLTFLVGPLFYQYLRSTLQKNAPVKKSVLLHFLPALLILIIQLPYLFATASFKFEVIRGAAHYPNLLQLPSHQFFLLINALILLSLFTYSILSYALLKRQDLEKQTIQFRFLKTLYFLYTGYAFSYLFYVLMVQSPFYYLVLDYSISIMMAVFIYGLAFLAYRKPHIIRQEKIRAAFQPVKYKNSTLTTNAIHSLKKRLEVFMEKEKPYYDSELRLPKLANALEVSPHHLSQVINVQYDQSFTNFINTYRIEQAEKLLEESDLQIIEIAYQVGFNNKTSFYKAFKMKHGVTPTEYRKVRIY